MMRSLMSDDSTTEEVEEVRGPPPRPPQPVRLSAEGPGPVTPEGKRPGLPSVPYLTVQYRILANVPSVSYGTNNVPSFEQ